MLPDPLRPFLVRLRADTGVDYAADLELLVFARRAAPEADVAAER